MYPPTAAVSMICRSNSVCVLSLELLLLVSDASTTIFVPPYVLVRFIWFIFIVGQTLKPAWKPKLVRIQYVAITLWSCKITELKLCLFILEICKSWLFSFWSSFSVEMISASRSVAMFSTCRIGDTAGNKTFWYCFTGVCIYSDYFAMFSLELKAAAGKSRVSVLIFLRVKLKAGNTCFQLK